MNDRQYDHYQVILSGSMKLSSGRKKTLLKLHELLRIPLESAELLLDGQKKIACHDLSHRDAYQVQQKLQEIGIESKIRLIPPKETIKNFDLVPEGEEQTPYKQLQEKVNRGEMSRCQKCETINHSTRVYCSQCGAQLTDIPSGGKSQLKTRILAIAMLILVLISLYFIY